jgi:DNA polymerase/3'-5' exonuclease PolX
MEEEIIKLQFPLKKDMPKNISDEHILKWLKDIHTDPISGESIKGNNRMYRFYANESLRRRVCYHPILQELAELSEENDKKPLEDTTKFPNNNLIISIFKQYILYLNQKLKDLPKATTSDIKKDKFSISRGRGVIYDAVKLIEGLNFDIKKGEDLESHKGIGKGTIARMNEILTTKKLKEMDEFMNSINDSEVRNVSLEELKKVYGIGEVFASKLYDEFKIKNISELRTGVNNKKVELHDSQIAGLTYYEDLNERIPRSEMKELDKLLEKIIHSVDKDIIYNIAGSFRRERLDSGDIDVLITYKKDTEEDFISQILHKLDNRGLLISILAQGNTKFNGIIRLSEGNLARRIDIRFVPFISYYPALLYFTGSGNFNVEMRIRAKNMGYKLSEYNISKIETKGNILPGKHISKKDIINETPVKVNSEKAIFDVLGMDYLEPKDRERGK